LSGQVDTGEVGDGVIGQAGGDTGLELVRGEDTGERQYGYERDCTSSGAEPGGTDGMHDGTMFVLVGGRRRVGTEAGALIRLAEPNSGWKKNTSQLNFRIFLQKHKRRHAPFRAHSRPATRLMSACCWRFAASTWKIPQRNPQASRIEEEKRDMFRSATLDRPALATLHRADIALEIPPAMGLPNIQAFRNRAGTRPGGRRTAGRMRRLSSRLPEPEPSFAKGTRLTGNPDCARSNFIALDQLTTHQGAPKCKTYF